MISNDLEGLSKFLDVLYSLSTNKDRWSEFSRGLMTLIPSTDFNISMIETASGKATIYQGTVTMDEQVMRPYFAHYHTINPYLNFSLSKMQAGYIAPSHHECPPHKFVRTEFYQDFFRKLDFFHTLHAVVLHQASLTVNIGLTRPKKMGLYEGEEQTLRYLLPHLQRAFHLVNILSERIAENRNLTDALNKLQQGVIIVNSIGRPLFLNRGAERIVEKRDGLRVDSSGILEAISVRATNQLRKIIDSAAKAKLNAETACGGAIKVQRLLSLQPLSLLIAPLNREHADQIAHQPAAIIFISDPDSQIETEERFIQKLYHLTPSEARLTLLLVQGKSIATASEQLKVSTNTTRTHLKRIFSKTGARRQSDLIKLLINDPALR